MKTGGIRMWMMQGPGGLAPFYGCAFTRKDLCRSARGKGPLNCIPVKVIVTIDDPKAVSTPHNAIADAKGQVQGRVDW